MVFLKDFFFKKMILKKSVEKVSKRQKSMKNYPKGIELSVMVLFLFRVYAAVDPSDSGW